MKPNDNWVLCFCMFPIFLATPEFPANQNCSFKRAKRVQDSKENVDGPDDVDDEY